MNVKSFIFYSNKKNCPLSDTCFLPEEWNTRAVTIPQEVVEALEKGIELLEPFQGLNLLGERALDMHRKALALINAGDK